MNRSGSIPINKTLREYTQRYFSEAPFFVVGVSGGPDSMALLYSLFLNKIDALVVHVNYGKRGKESDLDQELVEGFAAEWDFECCSVQVDSYQREDNNFQNWARKERYRIFHDLLDQYEADAILTAHHKDDQLETILQKIFRGGGPSSWKGMQVKEGRLFRPLLEFSKEEVIAFCEEHHIPFRTDASNLESEYARNFIRNEFSEALTSFFPGWEDNILRLQEFGQLNDDALDYILSEISTENTLPVEKLKGMNSDLFLGLIKRFINKKAGEVTLSKGVLKELGDILNWTVGASKPIGSGFEIVRDRAYISLKKNDNSKVSDYIDEQNASNGIDISGLYFNIKDIISADSDIYMDADKVNWPLNLRRWQQGDSFQPLGMTGSQKISDHLTNRKISASKKENALILSGSDSTIYAIIYPEKAVNGESGSVSELQKADKATKRYLTINIKDYTV